MRYAMLLVTVGLVAISQLAAQDTLPIAPGQRVRLALDGHRRITGVLQAQGADSIRVQQYWNTPPLVIARSSVSGVEVSTRRHSNAGTGAVAGLLTLGMIGAVAGASCDGEFLCPGPAAGGAALGLFGALVGGAFGALSYSETWESVSQRRAQLSIVAPVEGRGLGVGLRVAF